MSPSSQPDPKDPELKRQAGSCPNEAKWQSGPAVMPPREPQEQPSAQPVRAYLGLGSNLEPRLWHLQCALDTLDSLEGLRVTAVSRVFETDPVGPEQPLFLNAAVEVVTTRSPMDLLKACHVAEAQAKRVRTQRWGPRTLDADVLTYDRVHIESEELTIPHPRMAERPFVLIPLADIAPHLVSSPQDSHGVRPTVHRIRLPSRS